MDAPSDEVAGLSAAVSGGVVDTGPLREATARFIHLTDSCSATLITPEWVMTSAHCVGRSSHGGGWSGFVSFRDNAGAPIGHIAPFVEARRCYLHPEAVIAGATRCEDAPGNDFGSLFSSRDIALVRLATPITRVQPRPIGPPRFCLNTTTPPTAPGHVRGWGGITAVTSPDSILANVNLTPGAWDSVTMTLLATGGAPIAGDSGGTITTASDDSNGSVVGVTEKTSQAVKVWAPVIHNWIWSVLDASGNCDLGSPPGSCVLREPVPAGGSICGDDLCSGIETFESCPSDCLPALPDADGDGLPDVRDLCPGLSGVAPGASITSGNHTDADHDFVGDACEVAGCNHGCGIDTDGDRVPDDCDNCDANINYDQADCDADGIGDACEPDADADGYPETCGRDNCPSVTNPLQENCNSEAEAAAGRPPAGDACDVVPCPDTLVLRSRYTSSGGVVTYETDTLLNDALVQGGSRTAFVGNRFCPCAVANDDTVAARVLCADSSGAQCTLNSFTQYDSLSEPTRWKWPSAAWSFPAPAGGTFYDPNAAVLKREALLTFAPPTLGIASTFRTSGQRTWSLASDVPRWTPGFVWNVANPYRGVVWSHAPRTSTLASLAERNASSNYYSGGLEAPSVARAALPSEPIYAGAFLPPRGFSAYAQSWPRPFIVLPPCLASGTCVNGEKPWLRVGEDDIPANAWLSTSAVDALTTPGVLVPTSDAEQWLPSAGFRHIVLATTGDAIKAWTYTDSNGVLQGADVDEDRGASRPAARQLFFTAFSSTRREVFVAGGKTLGGVELKDIWRFSLDSLRWTQVVANYTQTIRGIAIEPGRRGRLWVESGTGAAGLHTLTALHASTGAELYARNITFRSFVSTTGITADATGLGVIVYCSGGTNPGTHGIDRFIRSGAAALQHVGEASGQGLLIGRPTASVLGVSVATTPVNATNRRRTVGYRDAALALDGALADGCTED